jgi:hypothetical protein
VEFLAVNEVTRLVFEASREDFPLVLQEVNERARKRDSLEYIRGASRLLFNTLEFAASVQGSEGSAAQMRNFLATASHQKGRDIVPTRQSVIALANALTPQLKEMTRDDSLSKLSIDDSMDTLTALDRLFAAVEYGVEGNTGASELVGAVADCSLQLANYGLSDINVIIPPRPGQQPTPPYLAGEGGSRKQVGALKRLRRPGYGSYS